MRLRAVFFAMAVLGGTGVAAWQIGTTATAEVERRTSEELRAALADAGQDWAEVGIDGLITILTGAAPDESAHLRAVEVVHQRVGMRRLDDLTTLRPAPPPPTPDFALELLRNPAEVSLMGLAPGLETVARIRAALAAAGVAAEVTDMLETTGHPPPPGWEASLAFGLDVLTEMPRARIAIAPGEVTVTAVLTSDTARASMQAALSAAVPEDVALHLDLSAPRPVIVPFRLDFRLAAGTARLLACSAETETAAEEILAAARAAGLTGEADCVLGLGAPSAGWAAAAAAGIAAVTELGGGSFELTDSRAQLTGPAGIDAEALAAVSGRLTAALPAGYPLSTTTPSSAAARPGTDMPYAPRFDAVLGPDGTLLLGGAVHDAVSQAAIESYAAALFGHLQVSSSTMIDPDLPDGWPVRVLAGIEALAATFEGRLEVTPERITLSGRSLDAGADARVEALLAAKAAGDASVEVRFDALAAARAAEAALPAPERCADEVAAILQSEAIVFRPGSAEIDPVSGGVIAAIADVLRACPGAAFEVAGHTDSSGEADANQRLSEARAAEVAAALGEQDLPLIDLHPRGYGASRPRASNETAELRALNRRIELTLYVPAEEQVVAALPVGSDEVAFPDGLQAEPALPDAATCAAEIAGILEADPIEFDLGSTRISQRAPTC